MKNAAFRNLMPLMCCLGSVGCLSSTLGEDPASDGPADNSEVDGAFESTGDGGTTSAEPSPIETGGTGNPDTPMTGSGGEGPTSGAGGALGTGGESGEQPGEDPVGTVTDGPLKIVWKATATVTINTGSGNFNYDVDWDDDGVFDQIGVTGPVTHDYGELGDHTVAIRGEFPHMVENCSVDIIQWGNIAWKSFRSSFDRCSGTVISASDVPDLSNVTDMAFAFARSAVEFGPAFGKWDTSNVTTMQNMFRHSSGFNEDISAWDTSSVADMSLMFWKAFAFNQDISGWDTSGVTNMRIMFQHARAFNQSIGDWDVTKVATMDALFGSSALDTASYDATLIGWAAQSGHVSRTLDATGMTYCDGASARDDLIAAGWTIEGDALQCD